MTELTVRTNLVNSNTGQVTFLNITPSCLQLVLAFLISKSCCISLLDMEYLTKTGHEGEQHRDAELLNDVWIPSIY